MKLSKQALLGGGVLLGGSVLLYATLHQATITDHAKQATDAVTSIASTPASPNVTNASTTPLTADIQTEKNILAQKQKEREARVEQQEQAAEQYLTEQQRIEAEALARSRAENQLYTNAHAPASTQAPIAQPVVKPRPVNDNVATGTEDHSTQNATQAATVKTQIVPTPVTEPTKTQINKTKTPKPENAKSNSVKATVLTSQPAKEKDKSRPNNYQVQRGDGLINLSRRYNVSLDALAQANGLSKASVLHVGQNLKIPTASQVNQLQQQAVQREHERQQDIARKQQEAARKEQQRQQELARKDQEAQQKQQQKQDFEAAQQKLKQARQTVKETDAKGNFGVQVALATDQAKAEEIARKLQAAGYKVKTSQTSRGVRVVVGPETGKVAALALKDKVNSDPRLATKNAWVLYW